MRPWTTEYTGRYDHATIDSSALRDNHLGDPATRPLWVYLPPGYDDDPERRYPSIYLIQGYTGSLDMWGFRTPFRPTVLERIDDLFAGRDGPAPPPALIVGVDAWTAYGGSQYVDSIGTGRYHSYLCADLVSFVDARWRTIQHRDSRAITGKSSGGFGAMITPMLRPDLFGAFASHAGDSLYEASYLPDFPGHYRALRDMYDRSVDNFLADFRSRPAFSRPTDRLIELIGVSAAFSPAPDGTPELPFDVHTGRLTEAWDRWLEWDPVRMIPKYADALGSLRAIYVDAGDQDDCQLDLGAQAFVSELAAHGIDDVQFEIFPGTHMKIDYRYPLALRFLAERLAA